MRTEPTHMPFARPCVAAAALMWASAAIAAPLAPSGASAAALAAYRLALGGLALACWPGARRVLATAAVLPRAPLMLAALAMALFQWTFFASIPGAGAGASALLSTAAAPFVADLIQCAPCGGVPPRWLPGLGCVGAAVAVLAAGNAPLHSLLLALASGAAYAVYACVAARLGEGGEHHSLAVTAIALLAAGLSLMPLAARDLFVLASPRGALVAAYLGLASTALAYRLFVPALLRLGPGRALGLLYIEPAAALLGGWLVLGEALGACQLLAAALLAAAELLRAARPFIPTNHPKEQTT